MKKNVFISIKLDQRREKGNGKYPVKLRVFRSYPRKQKLYNTIFEMSREEFQSVWETVRPREQFKPSRKGLESLLEKAEGICDKMDFFDFDLFEKKMFQQRGEARSLSFLFNEVIEDFKRKGSIGTAESYANALKSFQAFRGNNITIDEINPRWLHEYERWMINKGAKRSTVSVYVRPLRAVFKRMIEEGEEVLYPFGRRKYSPPPNKSNALEKTLSIDQLQKLYKVEPSNDFQQEALDFWFLSFHLYGMNAADILNLKWKDINGGAIWVIRSKTKGKNPNARRKPINSDAMTIIDKYSVASTSATNVNAYVFDTLENGMKPEEERRAIKNFTRKINQHLKKLCKQNDLPQISWQWARHTFATVMRNRGESFSLLAELMGHMDTRTTQLYYAGPLEEKKKELSENLVTLLKN